MAIDCVKVSIWVFAVCNLLSCLFILVLLEVSVLILGIWKFMDKYRLYGG